MQRGSKEKQLFLNQSGTEMEFTSSTSVIQGLVLVLRFIDI